MIIFITKRKDHDPYIYKSAKIKVSDTLEALDEVFKQSVLGHDSEANGKRYWQTELLLLQFGTDQIQVVVDFTEPDYLSGWRKQVTDHINGLLRTDHLYIGHNLKYDKNVGTPYGFNYPDFFDTLIAEQRLNLGTGLFNNLKDTYERRLGKFFPEDKETRKDFLLMNKNSKFLVKHILYAGADIGDIIAIALKQKEALAITNQTWFVRTVEFPLVKVLSEIELEGLNLDAVKFENLVKTKKIRRFECEKECDQEIKTLGKGNIKLLGGKYNTNRKTASVQQTNLFGTEVVETVNKNLHNINYNSSDQIADIVDRLALPPIMVLKVNDNTHQKEEKNSLSEDAIHTYLLKYRETPLRKFLETLLEYKGLQKFISSYGAKFLSEYIVKNGKREIGYLNKVTNRVHTQLKQCFTDNGRLSSGEDKKSKSEEVEKKMGVFNIQNLPADKEVRECFTLTQAELDLSYWFSTIDWSGAELIIMAAMADDQYLNDLGSNKIIDGVKVEGDMHSPTATDCWRAVYQYRKSGMINAYRLVQETPTHTSDRGPGREGHDTGHLTNDQIFLMYSSIAVEKVMTIQDSKGKKYILTEDFLIDKKTNKQLRTDFKPMIFGTVYGLQAKKGGETLNIPKEEAQIIINVIKNKFPKVFKLVEGFANQAFRHGYVIFNSRSNNRRYFTPVLEILKTIDQTKYSDKQIINYVKEKLNFSIVADISAEAFNVPISGTQADMLKESLVEIRKHPDYEKCKAKLLLSVHDENGAKHIGKEFGETIKQIMIDTANKYLEIYSKNIRMGADCQILHSWTK